MHKVTDVLISGIWMTQLPTINGQLVRESTYFDDGTFGVVEYTFESAEPVQDWRVTKLAFKQRFTQQERIAIRAAAESIPEVYDFQDLVNSATFIDLSRPDTIAAVNAIEQLGLIEAGRASIILGPPVEEIERYKD